MDYSKLSDQEIAANVLIAQGYKLIDDGYGYSIYISDSGRKDTGPMASKQFIFDPCNNAADAWPIISANNISLHAPRHNEGWMAEFTGSDDDVNDGFNVDYFESHNANPLRAAMIVFLMMQESE